jgi:hypothetical protein
VRAPRQTTAPRRAEALLFADAFAVTAVAPDGKARSKRPPYGFSAFDAKPPRLLVTGDGHVAKAFDAALRPLGGLVPPRAALLPGGELLVLGVREGAMTVRLGDADACDVHEPPMLSVEVGPPRGERAWGVPGPPAVALDGGVALPWRDGAVRLGHLDAAAGVLTLHAEVRPAVSIGTRRVALPGRDRHALAGLDLAGATLHLAVVGADGTVVHRSHHRALGLPARDGDTLWLQRDDATVAGVGLDGDDRGALPIPAEHRGPGTVFVQGGEAWFIPWHGEVVIALARGEVIDRRIPGDASVRRHVADLLRRMDVAGRPAGLTIHLRTLRVTGGAKPAVQLSLSHDGGDLGPLAHSVAGAMLGWWQWCPPPGFTALQPTGGWVTAARTADAPELLAALSALDAHGLSLCAAAGHWDQIHAFGPVAPFTTSAAAAFLGALLADGPQRPAGERALAAPLTVEDVASSIVRLRAAGHPTRAVESLVDRVLARHRPPDAPALAAALAARTPLLKLVPRPRKRPPAG